MSCSSADEIWHPSESEVESVSGKVSDPPMSDTDLVQPKQVEVITENPDTTEDEEKDEKPKRRKPRYHGPTGCPRGVPKGTRYPSRKPIAAKHIRETLDGICAEERAFIASKKRYERNARREALMQKIGRVRTQDLSAQDEDCLQRFGALPGSLMPYTPPVEPVVPKKGSLDIFNAMKRAKREQKQKKRRVASQEEDD